ncbi:MAG: SWIM zinc finger family protein [Acidobacteria bacterium]|nr:SWIM zinc finger family protein [Acidobacteriota bacterium]
MSQIDVLGRHVRENIKSRGRDYFVRKAVRIVFADHEFVAAKVTGSQVYDVDLERDGRVLIYSCDCPYFEDHLDVCKHVWATLLELEKRGHFAKWSRDFPTDLLPTDSDGDMEDEYFDEDDFDEEDELSIDPESWQLTQQEEPSASSQQTSSWHLLLRKMNRSEEPGIAQPSWPVGREIIYVLDYTRLPYGTNLSIHINARDPKKSGEWKKQKPLVLSHNLIPTLPDPLDRDILNRLVGVHRGRWSYGPDESTYHFQPTRHDLLTLLPLFSGTGRLFFRTAELDEGRAVRWDSSEPWEFCIEVRRDDGGSQYEICGAFHKDGVRLNPANLEYVFSEGILITGDSIARFRGSFQWISFFRKEGSFFVPFDEADEWLEIMLGIPSVPRLILPEELRLQEITADPQPLANISARQESWQASNLTAEVFYKYLDHTIGEAFSASGIALVAQKQRILRNREAEARFLQQFEAAGFKRRTDYHGRTLWMIPQSRLPGAVRDLVAAGWMVEAEGKLFRNPNSFSMRISSGIDWFELHGTVDFGETRIAMPKLLAALKRRESTILLDDGSYGMLPEEWLEKYAMLAGIGSSHGDHVRFQRNQAGLLDVLLASQPEVSCDEMFDRLRNELKSFTGICAANPPEGFRGQLRPYQQDGLGWLHFLQNFGFGGCLADDMGLGKTIQVLSLLEERRVLRRTNREPDRPPPSLVVMPRSLVFNWKQEAARFTPELRILEHTGGVRIRDHRHFDDYDAVFTTYGTLRRDASFFKDKLFDYVILDEAQAIKNSSTESAKAARLLRGHNRLALSGTPIENHLGELWSLFDFLNPGMLGSATVFKLGKGAGMKLSDEQRNQLSRALRPFILRRTKAQVASDLPEKVEQTLFCQLEPAQRKMYDELRDHYRRTLLNRIEQDGLNKSKIHILEALLRLRQAAIHPGLIDRSRANETSAKLEMLMPQLAEILDEGHKALIFSQFTSMLAIVRSRLDQLGIRYEYLDGQTNDRAAPVERFQNDPESKLFLISLKAGGLGLNLTAAEYVYLLDPWWNPAVEAQAVDRTHRIGQTRSVFAYRLIAKDTVEEKVLELQETKREIADAIITQDNSLLRNLGTEDLALLLS